MRRTFSSSVFCQQRGKILLIRHKLLDAWLPVGGEREGDETPRETAAREVTEETAFTPHFPAIRHAPAGTPPGFIGYEEHDAGPKGLHMNFCFLALVEGQGEPVNDGSWDEYRWVDPFDVQGSRMKIPANVRDLLWAIAMRIPT
jgi:ADP-ribose pyrophosphatase YjhB (NUDIX family)